MTKPIFEVGKTYEARSICDGDCVFTITVTERSAKMLTYDYDGDTRRSMIRHDEHEGEYIQPDRYSMAPVFRACRLHAPTPERQASEQSPQMGKIIPFPSPLKMFDSIITAEGCVIRTGGYVLGNWGAGFPEERGIIIQIASDPSRSDAILIAILWLAEQDRPTKITFTTPENVHRKGWRSDNGSSIGVFLEE